MFKKSYFLVDSKDMQIVKTDFVKFYLNSFIVRTGVAFAYKFYVAKRDAEGQFHMYYFKTKKEMHEIFSDHCFAVIASCNNVTGDVGLYLEPDLRDDFYNDSRLEDINVDSFSFYCDYIYV